MAHPTDDIVGAMQSPSQEDRQRIQKAYDFAHRAHGDEKRKSGDPYITHPHAIALRLATLHMDTDTIVAGILHDTVEDTPVTPEEIEREFGGSVRYLVDGVTKLSKLKYRGLDRNIESLRRLLIATANDIRVIIIKLADRLHNMETLSHVAPEKQHRIAKETMEVYVPIAERLGMGMFRMMLDDLAFRALDPKGYDEAVALLREKREEMEESLEEVLKDIKRHLAEGKLRTFRTEMRIKGVHSFARKLEEKEGNVDKVFDLFAIRIVVPTVEDCYRAFGIVHAAFRPMPGRIKDYIASPKPNGYRSLHTVVITGHNVAVEVQIRTEEMHLESQYGVASHFSYKTGVGSKDLAGTKWIRAVVPRLMHTKSTEAPHTPSWLKDLAHVANEHSAETLEEALKQDFFAERMFVFTPQGDVIDLPVGATPIDFAYAIHSDIGDTMSGARVNGKMVSIDSALHNGDKIEIITRKSGLPNKKWLEIVKTAGAKKHIRMALARGEQQKRG